jgi:transcriptional regulator PpsR
MSSASSRDETAQHPAAIWPEDVPPVGSKVVDAVSDLLLMVDAAGVVRAAAGRATGLLDGTSGWIGRTFPDIVSPDSRAKAASLLATAASDADTTSEINHPALEGGHRLFGYRLVADGAARLRCLAGRDLTPLVTLQNRLLETQQAMEREYARLRLAETRYRVIFHSASEPILIADAASLRLTEANPAALRELGLRGDRLSHVTLTSLFSPMSGDALEAMLASALNSGLTAEAEVSRPGSARKTTIRALPFRQDKGLHLLIRLRPPAHESLAQSSDPSLRDVHGMVEQTPDGCVIMSPDRIVLHANRAFLELAQLGSRHQAVGESLERWLGRPGIDLPLIQETLADHGVIRNFPTIIRGAFGGIEAVELSAVTAWAGDSGSTGLIIRSRGVQSALQAARHQGLPRSMDQLAQLVGTVPLKDIVREVSDVIEKLCIESALDLSRDNRAAAAQMLGLSRQSFYAKLRRHGWGAFVDQGETR